MDKSIEQTIKRIKRFGLTCTLNDNDTIRYFHNGREYVEIGGLKWATCNVGAEKPTDSGLYFQWGDTQGYTDEQVRNGEKRFDWDNYKYGTYDSLTKYNGSDSKTVLESSNDAATINMGASWRTPTRDEFKVLFESTTNEWVTNYQGSGINGRLFTDKKDSSKTLFFPAAGSCLDGSVDYVGSGGYYWSSSLRTSGVVYGRLLGFYSGDCYVYYGYRCVGFAVRGVVG